MSIHRDPKFIAMYNSGASRKEMGVAFGIAYRSVNNHVKRAADEGIITMKLARYTAEEDAMLLKLSDEGLSQAEIGKRVGRSKASVCNRLLSLGRRGARAKRGTFWNEERSAEFLRLFPNHPYRKIAAIMGTTVGAISSRANRLGMKSELIYNAWSEDDEAFLRANYQTMSQTEMANELGRHQTTIAKYMKKLSLRREVEKRAFIAPRARSGPVPVEDEKTPDTARPWLTRLRGECAYPYGKRGDIHSCCLPVWNGSPWCEDHAALCGGYGKVAAAA